MMLTNYFHISMNLVQNVESNILSLIVTLPADVQPYERAII